MTSFLRLTTVNFTNILRYSATTLLTLFFSLALSNVNATITNVTITSPTTGSPVSIAAGCSVTINFTYSANNAGANTGGATINIKTAGGAVVVFGTIPGLQKNVTNSPQTITLTIPAGAAVGSYTVEVIVAQPAGTTMTDTEVGAINVTAARTATIDYTGTPFCSNAGTQEVTQTGVAGGTYSAPEGLTINAGNGTITPSTSTSGTYLVTYTVAAAGGCPEITATKSVTVTAAPTATAGTAVSTCSNAAVNITEGSGATNQSSVAWTSDGTGTIANATSLTTATYTPGAGESGSVTLTLTANGNGNCAPATSTKTLTITAAPTADAGTALSPTCSNAGAVNIATGSSATNQSSVAWTSDGTGTIANSTSLTTATYTPGAGESGTVTFTLTANGNGTCAAATSTRTLAVTAAPSVEAGDDLATCTNLGAVDIANGSSAANFSSVAWTSNGTGTIANATSLTTATYTPGAGETGDVTLRLTANGNGTCASVFSIKTLTISEPPTVDAGTDISTCSNAAANITAGSSATNYSSVVWTTSGTGTIENPNSLTTATYTPGEGESGPVTLRLTANGNAGCASVFELKTLTVLDVPVVTYTKTAVSCVGDDGSISLNATGSGALTFSWTGPGGFTSSSEDITGLAAGDYSVVVGDPNTCATTVPNISVLTAPALVAGKISVTNPSSCNENDGSITAVRIGGVNDGVGSVQYKLDGDATVPYQTSNVFTGLSAGTYTVTVMDSKGCESAPGAPITLTQAPPVDIALAYTTNASSCGGGTDGSITVTATGGVLPYHYLLNGVDVQTTNRSTYTFTGLSANTSYSVSVTDSKGCSSSTISDITLSQVAAPVATVAYRGNPTCAGGSNGFITVRATGGVAPYMYSTDGGTTYQKSYKFTNLAAGNYNILVKDAKNCTSNTVAVTLADGTEPCPGVPVTSSSSSLNSAKFNSSSSLKVQAWPNPSSTEFKLNLQSSRNDKVSIVVTDMFGKKVYQASGSGSKQYTFGSQFTAGIYTVQVMQGRVTQTIKVVKGN